MPKSRTAAAAAATPGRRVSKRSVWGCLTCRRRKVKCQSRATPCDACQRLHLTCTPSFGSNFKQWGVRLAGASDRLAAAPSSSLVSSPSSPSPRVPSPPSASSSPVETSHACSYFGSLAVPDANANARPAAVIAESHHDMFFLDAWPTPDPQPWDVDTPTPSFLDESDDAQTSPGGVYMQVQEPSSPSVLVPPPAHRFMADRSMANRPTTTALGCDNSRSYDEACWAPWMMPLPTTLRPRLDDDHALVVYYKQKLSTFFSFRWAGSSSWNFYSYAILSSENQPASPLRHSILAWTSAHLILQNQISSPHTQFHHYAQARAAVDALREELAGAAATTAAAAKAKITGRDSSGTDRAISAKLRLFLSTSLFLAHCDVMSGDNAALAQELAGVHQLLAGNWPRFQQALGSLEARILVWLAYLDLRANLWVSLTGRQRRRQRRQQRQKRDGLFSFLTQHAGGSITRMRAMRGDRYYLTECFGALLPQHELEDDLLQEPAKRLSDDIMSTYATIQDLADWLDGLNDDGVVNDAQLVEELRLAKIQAIRANIARIQAEIKVVHATLLAASSGREHRVRTACHRLFTEAKALAATVLLNRVVAPDVRTDDDAQAAARQIVGIARQLRDTGHLGSPRSLVWPLPVFVAGIELTDPIYQDWVLHYLQEVASWSTCTKRARELLRRVIARQDALGRRVCVGDVIGELGEAIMV